MSDAPERVYGWPSKSAYGRLSLAGGPTGNMVEYIRADLCDPLSDPRVAVMVEALRLHKAWADAEESGPDYGGQTRDTHPDGERIWR